MALIPVAQAQRQGLSGWDSYLSSQIYLLDEINREWTATSLQREAYKILRKSIQMTMFDQMYQETINMQDALKIHGFPKALEIVKQPVKDHLMEYNRLDWMIIGLAIEVHLKAILMEKQIIVNEIECSGDDERIKKLSNNQKNRPIFISEIQDFPFMYDTESARNINPVISNKSIGLRTMLYRKEYVSAINASEEIINIFKDIQEIRNYMHLPLDYPELKTINSYKGNELYNKLVEYFNKNLVHHTKYLYDKLSRNFFDLYEFTTVIISD